MEITNSNTMQVLIVDDSQKTREKLREFLAAETGIEVIGEAENGEQAVRLAGLLHPGVILMDIKMSVMDGIAATKIIKKKFPEIYVVALSSYDNQEYRKAAQDSGADVYILKKSLTLELIPAVKNHSSLHKEHNTKGNKIRITDFC